MPDIEVLEVPENSVIVIHDEHDELLDEWDGVTDLPIVKELVARYPNNLVLVLSGGITIETLDEDQVRSVLLDLLQHRERRREGK
jgi:hypothetical protein